MKNKALMHNNIWENCNNYDQMSNINLPEKNLHLSCPNANAYCVPPILINVSCFIPKHLLTKSLFYILC